MREEIEEAVNRLKKSKAPGVDNISAEEIQAAGNSGTEILLSMCRMIWEEEKFPQMWKKLIIPLHKKDTMNCDNYRGISLLPHCEKVMASVILQRIRQRTEEILSEAQAGFRPGRSTIDQLFTLRRLTEMYIEYGKYLYVCYTDFQKAFDSVWRIGLWRVMRFLGYEEKIVRILEALYQDTISAVRADGGLSDWFATVVGILQGCILSPLLFNKRQKLKVYNYV